MKYLPGKFIPTTELPNIEMASDSQTAESMSPKPIPFNRPCLGGNELRNIRRAIENGHISGGGQFTDRVEKTLLKRIRGSKRVLLTTSCTHALEMSAILSGISPGDEVIVPSFTFVSSALAFVMQGAVPVFADIRPDTLNIDETRLEELITKRTKAIVVVHYAGVACEMDQILEICRQYNLILIEDNAHGLFGSYRGRFLGSIGDFATQSFHETKNLYCGEGGALIVNDSNLIKRAEIIREKGTNRSQFFRGEIDKYSWVDKGSSYVISDMLAAFLDAQLEFADTIQQRRKRIWDTYDNALKSWSAKNDIATPYVPEYCDQAFHMYYLILPDQNSRDRFIDHLKKYAIHAVFHYLPLHSSKMGQKLGLAPDGCKVTQDLAYRLVRLPFFHGLSHEEQSRIIDSTMEFEC
ncbi:MAG: dTDP-4-amino-4,6-dideoxygalactose transaminase [Chromatiales bacterium]|jgi:dTDP-4-amino-4,6-dideoxygalactose transaminase